MRLSVNWLMIGWEGSNQVDSRSADAAECLDFGALHDTLQVLGG